MHLLVPPPIARLPIFAFVHWILSLEKSPGEAGFTGVFSTSFSPGRIWGLLIVIWEGQSCAISALLAVKTPFSCSEYFRENPIQQIHPYILHYRRSNQHYSTISTPFATMRLWPTASPPVSFLGDA